LREVDNDCLESVVPNFIYILCTSRNLNSVTIVVILYYHDFLIFHSNNKKGVVRITPAQSIGIISCKVERDWAATVFGKLPGRISLEVGCNRSMLVFEIAVLELKCDSAMRRIRKSGGGWSLCFQISGPVCIMNGWPILLISNFELQIIYVKCFELSVIYVIIHFANVTHSLNLINVS